jgi:hypothetical protein
MITLLDKKRSVIGNVQNLDEATLDQVLSRINALAPVVAQYSRVEIERVILASNPPGIYVGEM